MNKLGRRSLSVATLALILLGGLAMGFRLTAGAATATAAPAVNTPALRYQVPVSSVVATAKTGSLPLYSSPEAVEPASVVASPDPLGVDPVFLVRQQQGSWLYVYVPERPNGSSMWIPAQDVTLSTDPYALTVSLSRHVLTAWKDGEPLFTTPAAVGKPSTPTPTGTFFVTEVLRQPNPRGAYGPYAFGISAFSDQLEHFGGGPGQIGVHGTNEPSSIGHAASHGCVRLSNPTVTQLRSFLPLGTPVIIGR
ncbi:MAG TPA: L,D-transpeptidase [Acidimicrobiales bacterium]|nr:L,D-transpeptidase [Acidimicrobiales bacterium]